MSVDAGTVYSSIRVRLGDLDNDLKGVYARLGQLEKNITKSTTAGNTGFKNMFAAVVSGQAVLGLAQKGFQLLTGAIKDSIKVSVDAQEMISKYDVVFGGMGDAAEDAAKRYSDAFDLAGATSKQMLSNTGNLLQGMGATKEESLDLSLKVNTLASDLASFTNNQGGASAASEALTKALLGEKESMKTLGIAILDSDVNARVARNGQDKLTGTALKLAKAQATLELITEQSKNAIGDYERTAGSAANTQKRATESTKELQIALGTALNPATTLAADLWARVAGALAETIGYQNQLRDAKKDIKDQTESTEDLILVTEERLRIAKQNYAMLGTTSTEQARRSFQEIAQITETLNLYKTRQKYEKELNDLKKKSSNELAAWQKERIAFLEEEDKKAKAQAEKIAAISAAVLAYQTTLRETNKFVGDGLITEEEGKTRIYNANVQLAEQLAQYGSLAETWYKNAINGAKEYDAELERRNELEEMYLEVRDEQEAKDAEYSKNQLKRLNAVNDGFGIVNSAVGSAAEAIAMGDDAFKAFAKSGLNSIAALLDAIALEIEAHAIAAIATAPFNPITWSVASPFIAKGLAVSISAGAVRGWAGNFADGGIVGGSSYTGDKLTANVNSGEVINTAEDFRAMKEMISAFMNGQTGGDTVIYLTTTLDGKVIANNTTRYQKNRKV